AHIPMAALASILFLAAWHMSHHRHFTGVLKNAETSEKVVMVGTFIPTVLLDMVAGVAAGVFLAFLFHQVKRARAKASQ
ncbi:MAG: SulP family inorganic anion transporter, partial [Alphaproteobacteria bacterium]|nr:SulP family inorganic anion transporter [Alphaproteobacteria bacterium]